MQASILFHPLVIPTALMLRPLRHFQRILDLRCNHTQGNRPPAGTQIGLLCDPRSGNLDGSCPTWAPAIGIGNPSTGFLMCSGISSSSKLMTSANQTDVSATAAHSFPGVICVSQSSGLTYSSTIWWRHRCSLLNYASCHGRKGHDHYKVIRPLMVAESLDGHER